MSDTILNNACDFFASDQWWSQILDFMLSRCEPFRAAPSYSFEEYQIYDEYMKFLEKLIDVEMCQQLQVTPQQFEDHLLQGLEQNNPVATSVRDTIVHAADFVTFCTDMIAHNERIEKEVQELVQMIKQNMENHEDEKIKNYEILKEESSKTGKWSRVTYKMVNYGNKETTADFYLRKYNDGKILNERKILHIIVHTAIFLLYFPFSLIFG